MLARLALGVALGAATLSAAHAAEAPEARFTWRLEFGGPTGTFGTGYALAVGYRTHGADAPAAQLLELDVSDRAALARLAGLPLLQRAYRNDLADTRSGAADEKPWYSRQWVWWTLGGLGATAVLTSAGGGGSEEHHVQVTGPGTQFEPLDGQYGSVNGDQEGGYEVCANRGNPELPDNCASTGGG